MLSKLHVDINRNPNRYKIISKYFILRFGYCHRWWIGTRAVLSNVISCDDFDRDYYRFMSTINGFVLFMKLRKVAITTYTSNQKPILIKCLMFVFNSFRKWKLSEKGGKREIVQRSMSIKKKISNEKLFHFEKIVDKARTNRNQHSFNTDIDKHICEMPKEN